MTRNAVLGGLVMAALFGPAGVASADPDTTGKAKAFVAAHEARLKPLDVAAGKAWWDANTTGKDEDFKRKEDFFAKAAGQGHRMGH